MGSLPDPIESAPAARTWDWVPVRSLGPRQRDRIASHLLSLDAHDRYLRFGYPARDAQIQKYVDLLDFDHDEIFGIFNRRLELVAMAHLAFAMRVESEARPTNAEFGVSVAASARQRGFGQRLFEHAMLHARNRGVHTLLIHALSENTAMLRIANKLGATLERDGAESQARVTLPPDTLGSHIDALVDSQAAEIDYQLKRQGQKVDHVLDIISEVRSRIGASAHAGEA